MATRLGFALSTLILAGACDDSSAHPVAVTSPAILVRSMVLVDSGQIGELVDLEYFTDSAVAIIGDRGRSVDDTVRLRFRLPTAAGKSPDTTCRFCSSAADRDGGVAMTTSDTSYAILRFDRSGRQTRPVRRRDLAAVEFTRSERDSIVESRRALIQRAAAIVGRPPDRRSASEFIASAATVIHKPRFIPGGMMFDDENRLWVQRHVRAGSEATVDVFGHDGNLVTSVTFPPATLLRRVSGGRALTLKSNANGDLLIAEWVFPGIERNEQPLKTDTLR